jgi:hypothetical protein
MNEAAVSMGAVGRLDKLQRLLLFGGAALVALAIIATGFSGVALRKGNPALALALWPISANAAARLADRHVDQSLLPEAQALAVRALRISPMNSAALRVIVRTAQKRGDTALAETCLVLAARLGWRDGVAQLWLLDRALTAGDYTTAAQAADSLLRIRFASARGRAAITALINSPGGRTALVERIAERPPWANAVLRNLRAATPQQAEAASAMLIALDRRGIRPSDNIMIPLVADALAHGQGLVMHRLWNTLEPNIVTSSTGGLNDGKFSQLAADTTKWRPFGWSIAQSPQVRVETSSRKDYPFNPVLRIEGQGRRSNAAVTQLLALETGQYDLTFEYKLESGLRQAFIWQIQCLGQRSRILYDVAIPRSPGAGWQDNRLPFAVPKNCPGQRITLMIRPSPTTASAAAFDTVRIIPSPPRSNQNRVLAGTTNAGDGQIFGVARAD